MNIKIFALIFFVYFYSEIFAGDKVKVIPKGTPQGAFGIPSASDTYKVDFSSQRQTTPAPKPEPVQQAQEPVAQTTPTQPQEPEKKFYQRRLDEGDTKSASIEGLTKLVNHFTKSSGKTEDEVLQQCEDLLGYPKEMIEQYKAQKKRLKPNVTSKLSKTIIISCSDAIADFWNLNTMKYEPYKKEKLFQEISCQDDECISFNGVGSGKLLKILENQDMIQFTETINMFAFSWVVLFTYHKPLKKLTLHKSYTLGDMSSQVNIVWNNCRYKR